MIKPDKFSKVINSMIVNGFDKLESVGCLLDSDVGSVYPMNSDGSPDWSNEINLYEDEVSDESVSYTHLTLPTILLV